MSREMAEAVLSLYRQTQNAQLLVPIVGHLHKYEILWNHQPTPHTNMQPLSACVCL